jgi:hypothetical protein
MSGPFLFTSYGNHRLQGQLGEFRNPLSNSFFLGSSSRESMSIYQITSDNPQKDIFYNSFSMLTKVRLCDWVSNTSKIF